MNITELKKKLLDSADFWVEQRIDDLVERNPRMSVASVYLKRGARNWLSNERDTISKAMDGVSLFIADGDGNVNTDTLFEDLLSLFTAMEEMPYDYGMVSGTIGKGKIRIDIPDNILTNILFGNSDAVTITSDDIKELKELIK